jgi:hypothetical protein
MPDGPPPPSRDSLGYAGSFLVLLAVPGGLWCAIFALVNTLHYASDLPGQDSWVAYFMVMFWWGATASATTLVLALRRPAHTVRKMTAGLAAQTLALLWPLQLALLVGYAATSRSLPRTLRVLAVPAGVAVLIAGGTWGVRACDTTQVRRGNSPTAATVTTGWHSLPPLSPGSAGYEFPRGPASVWGTRSPGVRPLSSTHFA